MELKTRILVVEDDTSYAELLKIRLEKTGGYEVRIEDHLSRALSATFDFNPDLILLDLMMPGTDGAAVATQLKKDERFQGIPVIFLTSAVTHQEVAAQGGVIGGKYFLAKPVTVQELVVSIEKHLKK